jgi:hypothetical protein
MKKFLITSVVLVVLAFIVTTTGCYTASTVSTQEQAKETEQQQVGNQQALYVKTQPPPYFDWSQQRDILIQIYKAKNSSLATYSYTTSPFTGKITWESPTIGFPISGGTELTNPQQVVDGYYSHSLVIAQAEPDGTYSPSTSLGTWILCVNPDGTLSPAYIEDNVRTFTTPMKEVDGKLVPVEGGKSSINITIKKPNK